MLRDENMDNNGNSGVFALLRTGTQKLSAQQSALCAYILDNYREVAFYTVEELAKASRTSPATVVRTMKSIGYDSYKAFLDEIQRVMMTSNRSVWWELQKIWDNGGSEKEEPVLAWVARDDIEAIKDSLTPQLMESFNQAADMMEKARRIGLIGMRSSKFVAGFMHFMLNQLFHNSTFLSSTGADVIYDEVLNFGPEDLIIAVSIGGPHFVALTHEVVYFAKENNIPTILITTDMSNPAMDSATLPLCVEGAKMHYSIVQPVFLAEALITELGRRKQKEARQKLHKLEKTLGAKGVTLP